MITATTDQQSYWIGDVPTAPLTVVLDDEDGTVDLTPFTAAAVTLTNPAGVAVGAFTAAIGVESIVVSWPHTTALATPGLYTFSFVLSGAVARTRLAPLQFVVESVDGWHTLDSAHAQWMDAPSDDVMLYTMLDGARTAVTAYAPAIATGAPVPLPFRQAQLMQARAVWNATKTNDQGEIGPDGQAVRVYPLDKNIRQLLRPKRAISGMF